MQQALLDRGSGGELQNRSQLMRGSGYNDGATVSWKDDDDEEPLSVDVIRQQQKMMIEGIIYLIIRVSLFADKYIHI